MRRFKIVIILASNENVKNPFTHVVNFNYPDK